MTDAGYSALWQYVEKQIYGFEGAFGKKPLAIYLDRWTYQGFKQYVIRPEYLCICGIPVLLGVELEKGKINLSLSSDLFVI